MSWILEREKKVSKKELCAQAREWRDAESSWGGMLYDRWENRGGVGSGTTVQSVKNCSGLLRNMEQSSRAAERCSESCPGPMGKWEVDP